MEEDDVVLFRARVKFDYDAEDDTELTIGQGEIISVYKTSDNGWWFAEADDSACGWVPSNFLERIEEGDVQDVLEEAEPVLMNPAEDVPAEIVFTEAEVVDPDPVVQPKVEERTVAAAAAPAAAGAAQPAAPKKKDPLSHLAKAKDGEEGCGQCGRILAGGYVMAGAKFHEECFTCLVCNESLLNSGFIEKDGSLYCEKDFHYTFSPKCAHCKEPITDQYITALGRNYHPDHFVCKVCSQPFPDGMFHQYSEEPYCEQHFQELFAIKCGSCGKAILGRGFTVDEIEKTFHEECFNCADGHRIKDGEDFHVHDGKVYCHTHFKDLVLAKCAKCKKVIEADYLTVKNNNYHVDCFKCEECGNSILDGKFSIFKDQLLCHGCTKRAKSVTPAAPAAKVAPAAPAVGQAPVSVAKSKENAAAKRAEPTMKYGSAEARKANEEKVDVTEKKDAEIPQPPGAAPAVIPPQDYEGPYYSFEQLRGKTLDNQIDRFRREMYLSPDQFQKVFGMSKAAFFAAPAWRQKKLKQDKGLF
eukprot:TRINITY_DN79347_c0_g1_i1.p1 TRINITY_DN79347_c0_g1~~TRINITY_DN79347_c0_g1_i1.p1  ORF type:complete len:528 (-),score=141.54 TRINITY_DN79347_c0_g1_i1:62-1645(-)